MWGYQNNYFNHADFLIYQGNANIYQFSSAFIRKLF